MKHITACLPAYMLSRSNAQLRNAEVAITELVDGTAGQETRADLERKNVCGVKAVAGLGWVNLGEPHTSAAQFVDGSLLGGEHGSGSGLGRLYLVHPEDAVQAAGLSLERAVSQLLDLKLARVWWIFLPPADTALINA